MGFLIKFLKNTPKYKAWLGVAISVLAMVEDAVGKINEDKNLPNIK